MAKPKAKRPKNAKPGASGDSDPAFDTMLELDRLEELLEELNELGLSSVAELEARIHALEAQIDDEPATGDDGPV